MRHHSNQRTLGRSRSSRTALLRSLLVSLITNEKIVTTTAKAKEMRPQIERLITFAKRGSVASRRLVASRLGEPDDAVVRKLFNDIAPRFRERDGGYTRIIKMGRQPSGRDEAVIEFVA